MSVGPPYNLKHYWYWTQQKFLSGSPVWHTVLGIRDSRQHPPPPCTGKAHSLDREKLPGTVQCDRYAESMEVVQVKF